jgi:ABC-type glycerol-3-phosphate transport system permease component
MPILKPAWTTMLLLACQEMWTITPQGTRFSEQLKTLPQVMSSISAGGIARSGSAMAVTVLLMIPPIIVFLFSQSNVMETMSTSGIKE